ncbi:MAG: pyridoxamine 5'-phosphate oxidase family protein [Gammaproteobacteria bacterium]|nr:pyridoxamine 5'-phosphate oxidase family protein [Gammaproteobacteria bacterium]
MKQIIRHYSAGAVASVNADGSPSVSPKATFVIIDDNCIAYGDIRSPGTRANLLERPAVEVSFVDVLARVAVRVSGRAEVVARDSEMGRKLMPHFEATWSAYLDLMQEFVCITISRAELITSPAYDVGLKREELVKTNFEKLSKLID